MESPVVTVLDTWETLVPCSGFLELYMCKMCTIIRLMTSVWPSVWGWKEVDFVSLVSNRD
jgi:hypothetical protein